jgi:hypothetical protein
MMTERVVDVLEMVKVDVENGGIAARLPYSVDRRFQPQISWPGVFGVQEKRASASPFTLVSSYT